jgi:hypothetical protein
MANTWPDTFNEAPDGVRTIFTLVSGLTPTVEQTYIGGLLRLRSSSGALDSYTVNGPQFTFVSAPVAGETMLCFFTPGGVVAAGGGGGRSAAWPTVASAINDAATELGLIQADIGDPYAATDPNVLQLLRLLKSAGRELAKRRKWTHLIKEYTFNLATNTQSYTIPSDFGSMIDDSGWDRSTRFPLTGPLDSQDWQFLQATPVA